MRAKNFTEDKLKRGFRIWIPIIICIILVRCFVCTFAIVKGHSMYPTFENGELVFVNKLAYTMSEPEIGDIVIAVEPIDNEKVIKRITGIPGSTVSYMGKSIVLNEGEYFIEGDNVDSTDSKSYGAIPEDRILGQVVTTK